MNFAGEAGSLLKIEEDIRDTVAVVKKQWLTRPKDEHHPLPGREEAEWQTGPIRLKGITDASFWDMAEQKVPRPCRSCPADDQRCRLPAQFSPRMRNGALHSSVRQKEYDVVLMNPPFGAASKLEELSTASTRGRRTMSTRRSWSAAGTVPHGRLGAITSRTGFFLTSFQKWREEVLLKECRPVVVADLGYGVLDTAMVETAAYCLEAL